MANSQLSWIIVIVIVILLVWWFVSQCEDRKEGLEKNPDCGKYDSSGFVPGCYTAKGYCRKGYGRIGAFGRFCHIVPPPLPSPPCKCCPVKNLPPCH